MLIASSESNHWRGYCLSVLTKVMMVSLNTCLLVYLPLLCLAIYQFHCYVSCYIIIYQYVYQCLLVYMLAELIVTCMDTHTCLPHFPPPLSPAIARVSCLTLLEVVLDNRLTFTPHIFKAVLQAGQSTFDLETLKS